MKMSPDKVIGLALRSLDDWVSLGKCRRCGEQRRWFVRKGLDNSDEFVLAYSVRGSGETPEVPEVDENDLLG